MAKNKKKLKQRKRKQLQKSLKQFSKQVYKVNPPVITNNEEQKKHYQLKLDQIYKGTVKPLTAFYNTHSVMTFKCHSCGLVFFNKAGYMIGSKKQLHHECGYPYGMTGKAERLSSVSSSHKKHKQKNTTSNTLQIINTMIKEDKTYQEIAEKLTVNPRIIKDHFIQEGLI